jgi:hypothetical protein
MNGNLASSPIKNNFLPIIDLPLFRALSQGQNQTGVPADLDFPQNGPSGPNPLANMDRGVQIR